MERICFASFSSRVSMRTRRNHPCSCLQGSRWGFAITLTGVISYDISSAGQGRAEKFLLDWYQGFNRPSDVVLPPTARCRSPAYRFAAPCA